MGVKKGTKLTNNPKNITFKFRFDAETERKLIKISEVKKVSKAQVLREGVEKQYAELFKA